MTRLIRCFFKLFGLPFRILKHSSGKLIVYIPSVGYVTYTLTGSWLLALFFGIVAVLVHLVIKIYK